MTTADIFNVGADLRGPDGTVYRIKKPTLYQQGEFQRWLEQRAHDAVDRSTATEDQKARRHHLIDIDAGLGKYEWDGPIALEAMWSIAGLTKILTIVCRDQGVTDEQAEAVISHNLRESAARLLLGAARDPKLRADLALVLGSLGLPMDWMESEPNVSSFNSSSSHPSTDPSPNSEGSPTIKSSSCTMSNAAPTES